MQKTHSLVLKSDQFDKAFDFLKQYGEEFKNGNQYVKWHIKGNKFSSIMYTSGKLVLQISDVNIEKKILGFFNSDEEDFKSHIGSDEVGKGDYFGPLVVCCCYVKEENLEEIKSLGIMDSKKISDENILKIAKELKNIVDYEVKTIQPIEYNELISKFENVAIVLAKAHIEVIEKLVKKLKGKKIHSIVIDQFSKSKRRLLDEYTLDIPLKQFHGGESDIAVACGSVLARYFFLQEFDKMNEKYCLRFPKGATHVISFGKSFVKRFGFDELNCVAKISFRTTKRIQ